MCCKGIFKRVIPFLLALGVGLFIASFFVSIAVPNFSGYRRGPSKYREMKRVNWDVEELKREKCRLKDEVERLKSERREILANTVEELDGLDLNAVPPPPPPPVVKLKEMKMKTVVVK